MLARVIDLDPVAFRSYRDERGVLSVMEICREVPFSVVRFFWIHGVPSGAARGGHAHKACHQYMVCGAGSLRLNAYDGHSDRSIGLTAGQALHVPPAIFTTEWFETEATVLMVFCDQLYDRDDYLADRDGLMEFRRQLAI